MPGVGTPQPSFLSVRSGFFRSEPLEPSPVLLPMEWFQADRLGAPTDDDASVGRTELHGRGPNWNEPVAHIVSATICSFISMNVVGSPLPSSAECRPCDIPYGQWFRPPGKHATRMGLTTAFFDQGPLSQKFVPSCKFFFIYPKPTS